MTLHWCVPQHDMPMFSRDQQPFNIGTGLFVCGPGLQLPICLGCCFAEVRRIELWRLSSTYSYSTSDAANRLDSNTGHARRRLIFHHLALSVMSSSHGWTLSSSLTGTSEGLKHLPAPCHRRNGVPLAVE